MKLFKVSQGILAPGTVLNAYEPDAGYLYMVRQALANGIPFLETLMQADVIASAKTKGPLTLPTFLIEAVFEEIRGMEFEARPSRIGTIHTFRTRDAATQFNKQFRGGAAGTYEVRIEDGDEFATHMDWTNASIRTREGIGPQLDPLRERARGYWRPDVPVPADYPEALVSGRVVVVRRVA